MTELNNLLAKIDDRRRVSFAFNFGYFFAKSFQNKTKNVLAERMHTISVYCIVLCLPALIFIINIHLIFMNGVHTPKQTKVKKKHD